MGFLPLGAILGILVVTSLQQVTSRGTRGTRLPVPTSETIPYVAEVMGAASYEETVEEDERPAANKGRRVQRKLPEPPQLTDQDLDPEPLEITEYQGVMGRPGVDFPVLPKIPRTDFSCRKVKSSGYYADLDTGCQVFHICDGGRKISFLCPNGTIFRQSHLICDWWFRVDCERSVEQYEESAEQLAHDQMIYKKRAEEIARAMAAKEASKLNDESVGKQSYVNNGQHGRRKQQQTQSYSNNAELERQVPAETASFTSNRHRFSNQLEQSNVNNNGVIRSTAQPPLVSTSPTTHKTPGIVQNYREQNNYTDQNYFQVRVRNQQIGAAPTTAPQNNNSLNQDTKQPPTRTNYNPYTGYDQHQTQPQYRTTSKQHFNQDNNNNNNNNQQPEQYRTSSKPDANQGYNNQQQTQYQPQAASKPEPSQGYNHNNNQQQTQYQSTSKPEYKEEYKNNYRSTTSRSQLQTSTGKPEVSFRNYKGTSNSEYQTVGDSVQEVNHTPLRSQSLYQSTSTPQVNYSYHSSAKPNRVKEIDYPPNTPQQLQSQYKTTVRPEVNYNSNLSNLKTTLRAQYQQYQTTSKPLTNQEYQNYKTTIKTQYQYQTIPTPDKNPVFNDYRSTSPYAQYQSTVKPDHKDNPVYNAIKYQNDSPNLLLNDQYSRINVVSPAPSMYSTSKSVENQFFLNDATSSPILPNQPTTAHYKDVNYFNQGKSSLAQTINSLSTPQGTFTVSPQYQQTGPQSNIFTAKIKPKNKDFSFLELQRHYETSSITTPAPPVTTPYYSVSSISPSVQPSYINPNPSTPFPSTIPHKNKQFTYIRNQSTTNSLPNSYRPGETFNKYATYNNSGRKEEIRPELINSLVDDGIKEKTTKRLHSPDSGVTPTSAKALHSLATYYGSPESAEDSSTILNDLGAKRPHVSEVVLNFHSISNGRNSFEDGTTVSPSTSTHNYNLPSELTKQTKDSYTHLFSESKEQTDKDDLIAKQSGLVFGDKTTSQKPQISTELELTDEDLTDVNTESHSRLRDSSELRELAQVFSRALSAYLEDPDTFKEILAQVRPTEPNIDVTTPSPEDEVLDFSDANRGNRIGTTGAPRTSLLNALVGDTKVNIGQINNLASKAKNYGRDNSIENFSVSPVAVQTFSNLIQYTTLRPTSIAYDINNIVSNTSTSEDVVGKLGSSEDPSYFPTAGSVGDTSRPRYGGFHNNTRRIPKNYSPYGAGLPNNITGTPIKIVSTTITTPFSNSANKSNINVSVPLISEAHSVNSLLSNTNNILYNNNAFSSSSEDTSDNFREKEKLLVPSTSQSLISASNYLRLAQNVKNENEKRPSKEAVSSTSHGDHVLIEFNKEELLPYFGQQPPFENLGKPSGFQTQNPNVNLEPYIPFTNSTRERIEKNSKLNTQSSINYNNGITKNYENSFAETGTASSVTERYTEVSLKNVRNDLNSEEKDSSTTWTASPSFVTMRFSEAVYDTSVNQTQSYFDTTTLLQATTYHPLHASSDQTLTTTNVDTTTFEPDVTYTNSEYETTVKTDKLSYQTTMSPDHPDYQNFLEEKAKEMFGMLNETTAGMLMNMMNQAESNLTIRRLVLLLVADRNKENKTPEESRSSLIRALLTEEGSNSDELPITDETPTEVPSTTTTTTSTTTPPPQTVEKKKSRVPRIRNNSRRFNQGPPNFKVYSSAKFYRGTDSQTAVAGSNVQSSTELNNKLNSAKLYIPSASTNTNTKLPYDSDARAVELLKTLYNLAARWG